MINAVMAVKSFAKKGYVSSRKTFALLSSYLVFVRTTTTFLRRTLFCSLIFGSLQADQKSEVISKMAPKQMRENDILFREGAYFILVGRYVCDGLWDVCVFLIYCRVSSLKNHSPHFHTRLISNK